MAGKRKRAPGGGRPRLDPGEAETVKVMVRIRPTRREQLQALADRHHGGNLSREIKLALKHWIERHEIPQLWNSALANAISLLADRIERRTGQSWTNDAMTREVVRENVERLVAHILAPLGGPVTVPAEVKEDAGILLALLIHAVSRPNSPRFAGTVIVDDPGLAVLVNDIARHLGDRPANVEARPELVAARQERERKKKGAVS